MLSIVKRHTNEKWVMLYVDRWLKAPAQDKEGHLTPRGKGTPQGGVISPLLANLFLHYGFDDWMIKQYPNNPFERYADDAIVHCRTKKEAEQLLKAIIERMAQYGLELNLQKTKIVYCKDSNRTGTHEHEKFTFLGYEFRPRHAKNYIKEDFVSFQPAVSSKATLKIWERIRSWKLHLQSHSTLEELAKRYNPVVRSWVNYYGTYYRSALYRVFRPLNHALIRWHCRKFKKLRHPNRARLRLQQTMKRCPALWAHWGIANG
jgi:RNA-directed DNA polymerase